MVSTEAFLFSLSVSVSVDGTNCKSETTLHASIEDDEILGELHGVTSFLFFDDDDEIAIVVIGFNVDEVGGVIMDVSNFVSDCDLLTQILLVWMTFFKTALIR